MFRSLRWRLFFTYLLLAGSVLLLVGVSLTLLLLRNPIAERLEQRRLALLLETFTARPGRWLEEVPSERLPQVARRIGRDSRVRVLILGPSGEVLGDSNPESPLPPGDILAELASGEAQSQGAVLDEEGVRWLYNSAKLAGGGRILLSVPLPRPGIRALSLWGDELFIPLLQAGLVALLFSALMAWMMARWVAAPMSRAAQAARSVAQGDYEQQLDPEGPAEARSMALAFNEMVRQVEASRQAQRDFVANVSHELKTPLTSIQGFAQAIMDGTAEDPQAQQRAAQVICEESDRVRRLVEDLLDLARMDAGQLTFEREPVDLSALLAGVQERMAVRAAEGGVCFVAHLPELPTVIGDGDRLAQVFTNLVDNAVKHTPEGGVVALRGEVRAGWVTIHVDDEGPGIPEEQLPRIFERFYQLDQARSGGTGRGVGLGLAISREIVHAHGGRLVAQSEPGRGSRFSLQLPIVRPQDPTLARSLD